MTYITNYDLNGNSVKLYKFKYNAKCINNLTDMLITWYKYNFSNTIIYI